MSDEALKIIENIKKKLDELEGNIKKNHAKYDKGRPEKHAEKEPECQDQ